MGWRYANNAEVTNERLEDAGELQQYYAMWVWLENGSGHQQRDEFGRCVWGDNEASSGRVAFGWRRKSMRIVRHQCPGDGVRELGIYSAAEADLSEVRAGKGGGMSDPIHIISLGAGVQSSTMALMAACGEITPMPIAAVFADTKGEPKAVYGWLNWLEKQLPFPVLRVSKSSLKETALTIRQKKDGSGKWAKTVIPTYIKNPDGSRGIVQRQCTYDWKVMMLQKTTIGLLSTYRRMVKDPLAIQWIGISRDEAFRMKPSRKPDLIQHRWPLIEMEMTRYDCQQWWDRTVGYKDRPSHFPPRSACTFCPYHSDAEWRNLKKNAPDEFAEVVQFERDLQAVKRETDNMRGIPFLHNSLKPLDQVDFSTEEERGQLNMFNNECEGMCGV